MHAEYLVQTARVHGEGLCIAAVRACRYASMPPKSLHTREVLHACRVPGAVHGKGLCHAAVPACCYASMRPKSVNTREVPHACRVPFVVHGKGLPHSAVPACHLSRLITREVPSLHMRRCQSNSGARVSIEYMVLLSCVRQQQPTGGLGGL